MSSGAGAAPYEDASGAGQVSGWVRRGDQVLKFLDWIFETVALAALSAIALLTVANALMRYLFSAPIPGALNVTLLYLMPALIFLALPRVQAQHAHIAATLVVDRLGPTLQRICRLFVTAVIVLISALMLNGAFFELQSAWGTTVGGFPALPMGPSWVFVPIGLLGLTVRGVWQILTELHRPQRQHTVADEADTETRSLDIV